MSEMVELDSGSFFFMSSIYPRRSTSIGIVSRYADAMKMGAIFPPPAVALVEGKNAIVDGVHRIKAMGLLSGLSPRMVKVEFLGEMTEEQAFEEAVKRNAIHGSRFDTQDLRKIVEVFGKYGRDLSYVSGVMRMSIEKLDFRREKPGSVNYVASDRRKDGHRHIVDLPADLAKEIMEEVSKPDREFSSVSKYVEHVLRESRERPARFGMGLQDLISWTTKFVREGKVGEEMLDSLTQLRDEIDSYLVRRRNGRKAGAEGAPGVTGDRTDGEDADPGEHGGGSMDSHGIGPEIQREAVETLRRAGGNPLSMAGLCSRMRKRGVLQERISGYRLGRWLRSNPDVAYSETYMHDPRFMLRENAERYLPSFLGDGSRAGDLPAGTADHASEGSPESSGSSTGNVVDVGTLTRAIMNSFNGMDGEEARKTAFQVLSYFGYERRCLANHLDEGDNQVFYMLEDKGLIRSMSYETLLADGRTWRTSEFELVYEKIMEAASAEKREKEADLYGNLPEEAWAR